MGYATQVVEFFSSEYKENKGYFIPQARNLKPKNKFAKLSNR